MFLLELGVCVDFFSSFCGVSCVKSFNGQQAEELRRVLLRGSDLEKYELIILQEANIAMAGKWTRIEDVFPIENGDILHCYVSLPERIFIAEKKAFDVI